MYKRLYELDSLGTISGSTTNILVDNPTFVNGLKITIDDLKNYILKDITLISPTVFGLDWNESTDTYVRTGDLIGVALNVSPGATLYNMKGCTLLDSGVVNYYLYPTNWAYKNDGVTASKLNGDDGQVMVQIPKFYYKYSYVGNTHSWNIATIPTTGYDVHPCFIKDGAEVDYRYAGAYEGVLYDVSGGVYTQGNSTQTKDWTATTGDKLSSVSGFTAVTNGTRAQFRAIAKNRGTGWRQMDYDLLHAIQVLYLVEYGSFYSQSVIGAGISNVTDWAAYNNYYPIATTGNANSIGNGTGNNAGGTTCSGEATKYIKYRGIEQIFGHVWKWIDGFNSYNNVPWVTNNSNYWADDTSTNYISGPTCCASNGYQSTLIPSSRFILPLTVGSDSSHKITDYYWQTHDNIWRVFIFGGSAGSAASDGAFCSLLYYASSDSASSFCSRLCF